MTDITFIYSVPYYVVCKGCYRS